MHYLKYKAMLIAINRFQKIDFLKISKSDFIFFEAEDVSSIFIEITNQNKIDIGEENYNKIFNEYKIIIDYVKMYKVNEILLKSEILNLDLYNTIYVPNYIFCRGNVNLLKNGLKLAIVGTRKISQYGIEITKRLIEKYIPTNCIVVSGLAIGTDTYALGYATDSGKKCIAVLPTPFSKITPKSNTDLNNDIIESNGLSITEYYDEKKVFKNNFIQRNKIIDMITDATIVIEFTENSGTMHQINNTIKSNKKLGLIIPSNKYSPAEFYEGYNAVKNRYNVSLLKDQITVEKFIEDIYFIKNSEDLSGADGQMKLVVE